MRIHIVSRLVPGRAKPPLAVTEGSDTGTAPEGTDTAPEDTPVTDDPGQAADCSIDITQLNYDWDGSPVCGSPTQLPDGSYHCYASNNSPSYTYIGLLEVSGDQLAYNGTSGTITYTDTTQVTVDGAGMDDATSVIVVTGTDGKPALWYRTSYGDVRCA